MKVLVFGQTGQVARALTEQPSPDLEIQTLSRQQADLGKPDACAALIADTDADVVINAAAYTAVDRAEEEEPLATTINATAPAAMATAAAKRALPFLHVSTDYVFDGSGTTARSPTYEVAPKNAYGRSKLAGEDGVIQAARDAQTQAAILRTSWVFSAHGSNFVKTMLRLSTTRDELSVVGDQIGGPTPADDIAAALLCMARKMVANPALTQGGAIYHFTGSPAISWAGFARETFRQAQRDVTVHDIPTADYPTPAARPLNSRLDCATLATDFGITSPDWTRGLARVLDALEQDRT